MRSTNRKLFRIIVLFLLSFLLCCSNSGCLDWLKNLCFKEEPRSLDSSITSNISNNDDKINEKKITYENLFIIGDVKKCKKVMEKLGADSWSEEEVTIYNKEIIDDSWHKTFKFYLCGNEVGKCEEIYKRIEQFSYFFFFVDITDSNSLNKLGKLLFDFYKQKFKKETLRFFLILLKTDPQEKQMISVKEAKEFCEENELNFFGEIDANNIIWDFDERDSFYKAILEVLSESEEKSDYKLVETKYDDEGFAYFVIKEGNDIWGMFLCGVKREDIIRQLVSDDYKLKRC